MNIGDRYRLAWRYEHRVEVEILALDGNHVEAEVVHRCEPACELLRMKRTLPIEGRLRYLRREFERIFVSMCDAPALPSAK